MTAGALSLETLDLEQQGRVLIVRFADPPYNYMTARMQRDLDVLSRAVDADRSVGAVILTGGIEGRYITHFDIGDILAAAQSSRGALPERGMRVLMRGVEAVQRVPGGGAMIEASPVAGILNVSRFNEVVLRIMRSPAVWIAAINGPCGGGGIEMSVCFDVRIAAEDGVSIILPELLIGLTTTVGAQRLVQLIGPARALEMLLEGSSYSPQEALEMGLVGHVVPGAELLARAIEMGGRYATRNRDTIATQKRIFNEYALLPPAESLRAEGAANASGVVSGVAPRALRKWVEMQRELSGESVFLANLEPWRRGEVVNLNEERVAESSGRGD
jgi:enoyl-CoA hydratase/carnithine racemase